MGARPFAPSRERPVTAKRKNCGGRNRLRQGDWNKGRSLIIPRIPCLQVAARATHNRRERGRMCDAGRAIAPACVHGRSGRGGGGGMPLPGSTCPNLRHSDRCPRGDDRSLACERGRRSARASGGDLTMRHEPLSLDDRKAGWQPMPDAGFARERRFVRRLHRMRTLGLGLGALCVASVLRLHEASLGWWLLLACNGLLWPHVALFLSSRSANPKRVEVRNLLVDSAAGGMWIAVMQFNLLPERPPRNDAGDRQGQRRRRAPAAARDGLRDRRLRPDVRAAGLPGEPRHADVRDRRVHAASGRLSRRDHRRCLRPGAARGRAEPPSGGTGTHRRPDGPLRIAGRASPSPRPNSRDTSAPAGPPR